MMSRTNESEFSDLDHENKITSYSSLTSAKPEVSTSKEIDYFDDDDNISINEKLSNIDLQIKDEMDDDPLIASLIKEPDERLPIDIENIVTYLDRIDACSQFSYNMKKAMAEVAILAVTGSKDMVILDSGEELDSWSIIIQGSVVVLSPESRSILGTLVEGQCFGVVASREKQLHKNILIALVDNCQFLCVSKDDFCRISEDSKLKFQEHFEDSNVVMVTEHRSIDNGLKQGHVIIKANPKKLLENLLENFSTIDPTYAEDFLICQRIFYQGFSEVSSQLLDWLKNAGTTDKAVKIIILWINYCYEDFEDEPELKQFINSAIEILKEKKMKGPLRFLGITCTGRTVAKWIQYNNSLYGSMTQSDLKFIGGMGHNIGIYVNSLKPDGDAAKAGLCVGDEIIAINDKLTDRMTSAEAEIMVESSKIVFLIYKRTQISNVIIEDQLKNIVKNSDVLTSSGSFCKPVVHSEVVPASQTVEPPSKKGTLIFKKIKFINKSNKNSTVDIRNKAAGEIASKGSLEMFESVPLDIFYSKTLSLTIHKNKILLDGLLDRSYSVNRIFKSDNTSRPLVFNSMVCALDIVKCFNEEKNSSLLYCLIVDPYTLEFKEHGIRPDENNLQEYRAFNKRLYVKRMGTSFPVEPIISDIKKDLSCSFIDLDPGLVAKMITLNDFDFFTRIKVSEYIYSVFEIKNKEKYPNLITFVEMCNNELFWVINQVLNESTVSARAKVIENFIKIAYICKELKNFNSVFFIISGLMHSAVTNLTTSWEKVLPKYQKIYKNLQQLLDPSRNMMKYRSLLHDTSRPTLIPIFPVLQKDLTFIHDGNSTWNDNLINFEKLRMISKEIRNITQYYSSTYDFMQLFTIKEIVPFKISPFIQIPFRSLYLMRPNSDGIIPLSHLGMTNFSTKFTSLFADQTRFYLNYISNTKRLIDESLMEERVFNHVKTRFNDLITCKEALISKSKFLENSVLNANLMKKSPATSHYNMNIDQNHKSRAFSSVVRNTKTLSNSVIETTMSVVLNKSSSVGLSTFDSLDRKGSET